MVKSSTLPNSYPGLYVYFRANRMFIKTWHFLWLVRSSALTKENDDFGTQPTYKTKISNICKVISYPYIFTAVRYWKYIETFDILQHLSLTHTLSPHTHFLPIYISIKFSYMRVTKDKTYTNPMLPMLVWKVKLVYEKWRH